MSVVLEREQAVDRGASAFIDAAKGRRRSDDAGAVACERVLGVPVSCLNMPLAVQTVLDWVRRRRSNFICVRDVHGVMRAVEDVDLKDIHHRAGMVTPDGMPLVWILRSRGHRQVGRVCGYDLVDAICANGLRQNCRHYFYGGKPGVAEKMAEALERRYPGLVVAGVSSPPFHALTSSDDAAETLKIAEANPDIVWVGMSTPKQELWMRDHVGRISGATLIGVGAAFDFHAGMIERAPFWMQRSGLEWLHRLVSEPQRLWRRYLLLAPKFAVMAAIEGLALGLRPKRDLSHSREAL